MKKLTLKQHWLVGTVLMAAGLTVSTIDLLKNFGTIRPVPLIVAFALAIGGYLYYRKFVRCPECGAMLPSTMKFPEKCDQCGKSLHEYNK